MRRSAVCLRFGLAVVLLMTTALGASDKKQRIDSHWKDREITVDGDNGEWPGPLVPVDEHQRLTAAAFNDAQFLYMVLSTSDAALRAQIIGQGLIVWFDPGGGEKKKFGVKFPVGMGEGDMPGRGRGFRRPDASAPGDPPQRVAPIEPPNRLEVFGPEKDDAHSFVADKVPGIAVKVAQVEGALVYELKVPLTKTDEFPYAIQAKSGALMGFGLETLKRERPSEGRRGGGMGGFGGGGGGGGGMGRGGGGMGRGGGRGMGRSDVEPPKPLKAWATIQLSSH
jgi:hypothetical protein